MILFDTRKILSGLPRSLFGRPRILCALPKILCGPSKILCGCPKSCLIGWKSWQGRRKIGLIFQKIRQVSPKIILIFSGF